MKLRQPYARHTVESIVGHNLVGRSQHLESLGHFGYSDDVMKTCCLPAASAALLLLTLGATSIPASQAQAPAAPPAAQAGHPSGKLVIWGDVALFDRPEAPDNCILTNRFKKGQRVGFRMTAIDGGTGDVENTATLVAHVTYARQDR